MIYVITYGIPSKIPAFVKISEAIPQDQIQLQSL